MKRIVVLLSAILLIFAVACSGDNPAPSGGNAGTNVPGGENVPPVTDGMFPMELAAPMSTIMGAHSDQPSSYEFESTYYYRSSDNVLLAKSVSGTGIQSKVNIEVDGYSILTRGSSVSIATEDGSYDLSKINQINVNDNQYSVGQDGFEEAKVELDDLIGKVSYTYFTSNTVSEENVVIADSSYVRTSNTTVDLVYDGFCISADSATKATGTVANRYELDREYDGIVGFTQFLMYENATQNEPSSMVIQFHGGQYDGKTYSVDMSMGM